MPNNIAVSITADVADLQVKRAIMSAELKAATKDLNDFAKTAQSSGLTDGLRTNMLAAGDATAKLRNQIRLVDGQLKSIAAGAAGTEAVAAGAGEATAAMGALQHGSAGVTRELIVLAREASRGNFSRMAGSLTILAGRMGLLEKLLNPVSLGIGAVVVAAGGLAFAAIKGEEEVRKFNGALEATNGYAGLTASGFQQMSEAIATQTQSGVGRAKASLTQLIQSGKFTGDTLRLIADDATIMGRLTGEGADKMLDQFGRMADGVAKFAKEYQDHYHQLTDAQFEYIQKLEDQGRTEEAEQALARDIYGYLGDQAPQKLGLLERAWNGVAGAIGGAWERLKGFGRDETTAEQIADVQAKIAAARRGDLGAHGEYGPAQDTSALEGQLRSLQAKARGEEQAAAARSRSAAVATKAVDAEAMLKEKYDDSRTSGEKLAKAIQDINQARADALAAPGADKDLINKEADAAIAQARKSDAPPKGPKAKAGPDIVSEWREQLQAQTVASNDFFADETRAELQFWQSKIGLTKQGSKEWLAVQTEIYNAQKTLAHQAYDEQLAGLNGKLEADRDNWSKEQADWQEKLAFIRSKQGEQSATYKDAYKAFEAAERDHERTMAQIARDAEQESLEELKGRLSAERSIREANAKTAEGQITEKGRYNPGGEVTAAAQTMALHQQLAAQEIADDREVYAQEDALRQQAEARALQTYGQDSQQYEQAVAAKKKADADFYEQQRVRQTQAVNQQLQDFQRVQQAWHSYVDPMVSTTGAQIKGLLEGTESWGQAIRNIGEEALNLVIQTIERMAEQWIVSMITGQAAQKATALSQVTSYAGIAGAAGVASMAAAPFPLDLSAPAFGAEMSAAALAFGSMGGFAKGLDVVPDDMIAQIHRGERIMPAADNSALMGALSMLTGKAGGARAGGRSAADGKAMTGLRDALGGNSAAVRRLTRQASQAMRMMGSPG